MQEFWCKFLCINIIMGAKFGRASLILFYGYESCRLRWTTNLQIGQGPIHVMNIIINKYVRLPTLLDPYKPTIICFFNILSTSPK